MKRILQLFFLLFVAVLIGLWLERTAGTIFIALKDQTIQMPLWFGIVSSLIVYLFLNGLFNILGKLLRVRESWLHFKQRWHEKHVQINTRRGLVEFSEGNWKQAENYFSKVLLKSSPDDETSLVNYLSAARAAQELGALERRDDYLREAQKTLPNAKVAIELTQAQLQILDEQWEQALATLNHLHSLTPHHAYITKLIMKVYLELKDWSHLEEWLPEIRQGRILDESALTALENKVYSGLLMQIADQTSEERLKAQWESFPKFIRKRVSLISLYVTKLLECEAYSEAEQQCRDALKHEWDNALIVLYGQCNVPDAESQLRFAEGFLKYYPNNPCLLSALGQIYLRRQLWGKAKNVFLRSMQIQPDARVYAALGLLSEKLDAPDEASQYYKQGLMLGNSQNLPL